MAILRIENGHFQFEKRPFFRREQTFFLSEIAFSVSGHGFISGQQALIFCGQAIQKAPHTLGGCAEACLLFAKILPWQ